MRISESIIRIGFLFIGLCLAGATASAGVTPESGSASDDLRHQLINELQKKYPGSRIELRGDLNLISGEIPRKDLVISLSSEKPDGRFQFQVKGIIAEKAVSATIEIDASAWVSTWVAKKRIHPGEKLSVEMFDKQEVDVTSGLAHEHRGLILSAEENISELQTRQSILQGHYVLSTAVQPIPSVDRGDVVRVRLTSGDIVLVTGAVAQEPGHVNKPINVITQRTKKHLIGTLKEGNLVEVKL